MKKPTPKRKRRVPLALKVAALDALRDRQGRVLPERLIEAAGDPDHPFHDDFTWDDRQAGIERRMDQAREIIRHYVFRAVRGEKVVMVPKYVSDPTIDRSAYVSTMVLAKKPDVARAVLEEELARIEAQVMRARALAFYYKAEDLLEPALRDIFRRARPEIARVADDEEMPAIAPS